VAGSEVQGMVADAAERERLLPEELLRQLRLLQLRMRRTAAGLLAGRYESVFRGAGIAFEEVRPYQVGDDVRTIDWNVTARMGQPYVKRFREEREQTVLLVIDVSASQQFGTVAKSKRQLCTELCALLGVSALLGNDRVGLTLFTDRIERHVGPGKGAGHLFRLIRDTALLEPAGRGTDLRAAIEYVMRTTKRRAVLFLVSDFWAEGYERALRVAARRHDLVALRTVDPAELSAPARGLLSVRDLESDSGAVIDLLSRSAREAFASAARAQAERVRAICESAGVDLVELRTDRPVVEPILELFQRRWRRRVH